MAKAAKAEAKAEMAKAAREMTAKETQKEVEARVKEARAKAARAEAEKAARAGGAGEGDDNYIHPSIGNAASPYMVYKLPMLSRKGAWAPQAGAPQEQLRQQDHSGR